MTLNETLDYLKSCGYMIIKVTSLDIVYRDRQMRKCNYPLFLCDKKSALVCPKCNAIFGCEVTGINYKIYRYCDETCSDYLSGLCDTDKLPKKVAKFPCISCANNHEYD